ncbi:hypothetical protein JW711_00135 [Candidatus Woesearchaeota archaeon]|nr:hypothetical protein [Candidatus Woesearchaeota archaeon]
MKTDILCPAGNENELAVFAAKLGFYEIIFLYQDLKAKPDLSFSSKLRLRKGVLVRSVNDVSAAKSRFDFVFAPAERPFFESRSVDFVVDAEQASPGKDFFYQRRAGLDDPMCKLAKERNIRVVFNAGFSEDSTLLGRMSQNAALCRKHKVGFLVATFARDAFGMRAPKDLDGLARVLRLV